MSVCCLVCLRALTVPSDRVGISNEDIVEVRDWETFEPVHLTKSLELLIDIHDIDDAKSSLVEVDTEELALCKEATIVDMTVDFLLEEGDSKCDCGMVGIHLCSFLA